MRGHEHPQDVKVAVVRSALAGELTQDTIAERYGVSRSAVQQWMRQARKVAGAAMTKAERRPQDWTAEEHFAAILETQGMTEEERGAWCRRHGLHCHQLAQWQRDAVAGSRGERAAREEAGLKRLRQENAELKRDLARKDKALAETTALLVLKKSPTPLGPGRGQLTGPEERQ